MKFKNIVKSFTVLAVMGCIFSLFSVSSKASEVSHSSPLSLLDITEAGYSDGYITKIENGVKKQVFVGTNHYKAKLEVKNHDKKVLIDISYSITDPKITGSEETPQQPSHIVIGEYILSGSSQFENRYVKNTSKKEIEKIHSIGLSKKEFDKILKNQFKKVTYI